VNIGGDTVFTHSVRRSFCVHDDSSSSPHVIHKQTSGPARRLHTLLAVGLLVGVLVVIVMFKLSHLVEIHALLRVPSS